MRAFITVSLATETEGKGSTILYKFGPGQAKYAVYKVVFYMCAVLPFSPWKELHPSIVLS